MLNLLARRKADLAHILDQDPTIDEEDITGNHLMILLVALHRLHLRQAHPQGAQVPAHHLLYRNNNLSKRGVGALRLLTVLRNDRMKFIASKIWSYVLLADSNGLFFLSLLQR